MTAGDWAAVIVGIAGVLVGLAAVPRTPSRSKIVAACAVLITIAVVIGAMSLLGRGDSTQAESPSSLVPPVSPTLPSSLLSVTPTISKSIPSTEAFSVRRETGRNPLKIVDNHIVDLDSLEPDWGTVGNIPDDYVDLQFVFGRMNAGNGSEIVKVASQPTYDDCRFETGYSGETGRPRVGDNYCFHTSDGRYARLLVRSADYPLSLDVTVWDAPATS